MIRDIPPAVRQNILSISYPNVKRAESNKNIADQGRDMNSASKQSHKSNDTDVYNCQTSSKENTLFLGGLGIRQAGIVGECIINHEKVKRRVQNSNAQQYSTLASATCAVVS